MTSSYFQQTLTNVLLHLLIKCDSKANCTNTEGSYIIVFFFNGYAGNGIKNRFAITLQAGAKVQLP